MEILELYKNEQQYWELQNIHLFGVGLINEYDLFCDIQKFISKCCEKYWNVESPCKIARYLNNGKLDHDANKKIKNSFRLELNSYNMCIDVFAKYKVDDEKIKEYKVAAIPTPSEDLSWIINKSHYVPRVTASRDFFTIVAKTNFNEISGEGWVYLIKEDKFSCILNKHKFNPTIEEIFNNRLSVRSKALLQSCIDEPLSIHNFKFALTQLPSFESNSIFNYKFSRMEYFEDIIINGGKYARPIFGRILGINTMLASASKQYSDTQENFEGCLVRITSPLFALENFRTVVNIYEGKFKPAFTYTDTTGFFDSFKTVTSGAAGRQRLLLDNIIVKNGMMYVKEGDKEVNMFNCMYTPQSKRLSCLSSAPFCNNDKPKRIMMNAKLTAQSVSLKEESDPLTHRIKARVGFADLEGYTYADSIIISKSFAKRLRTYDEEIYYVDKESKEYKILVDKYNNKTDFTLEELELIWPTKNKAILDSYENIKVTFIDDMSTYNARVFISWEIPFRLGDKITNLHGAKGTVGKILPDNKMPKLLNKVGNMEPGPLEVIISGFSTMRRGSLGQLFEAWALASGIDYEDKDYISYMVKNYQKEMQEYSKNSVVEYKGKRVTIPLGINNIMRLYHHASIHISTASAEDMFSKPLKLGEMEKFNLLSSDCTNILKELSIRSGHKHLGYRKLMKILEDKRVIPTDTTLSLSFANILKSMGYDIKLDGKSLVESDLTEELKSETDLELINTIIEEIFN